MTEDFQLTPSDKASQVWHRLKIELDRRLSHARLRNDQPLPEADTAALRGEIRTLKNLIALGEDRPPVIE